MIKINNLLFCYNLIKTHLLGYNLEIPYFNFSIE